MTEEAQTLVDPTAPTAMPPQQTLTPQQQMAIKNALMESFSKKYMEFIQGVINMPHNPQAMAKAMNHMDDAYVWIKEAISAAKLDQPSPQPIAPGENQTPEGAATQEETSPAPEAQSETPVTQD